MYITVCEKLIPLRQLNVDKVTKLPFSLALEGEACETKLGLNAVI